MHNLKKKITVYGVFCHHKILLNHIAYNFFTWNIPSNKASLTCLMVI